MKTFLVSAIVAILVITALLALVYFNGYDSAIQQLRESRPKVYRSSDYLFVTRGISAGMDYDEVEKLMGGATHGGGMFENNFGGSEPYCAYFDFAYRVPKRILGMDVNKVYLLETYWIYFDAAKRATRIKYQMFDVTNGNQTIEVDLLQIELSDALHIRWRD